MANKGRYTTLSSSAELEVKLLNTKTVLEKNIRSAEKELDVLDEASVTLARETDDIRERIVKNSEDLKELIDKHLGILNEILEATYQDNVTQIVAQKMFLEDKVKTWNADVEKCETALDKTPTDTDHLVSQRKVLQVMLNSVDVSFAKPDLKLTRATYITKDATLTDGILQELVGSLSKKKEVLENISQDVFEIKSFESPEYEITAMACEPDDRCVWTYAGSTTGIVKLTSEGEINDTITVDNDDVRSDDHEVRPYVIRTDDMIFASDGNILTTSPDGHSVTKIFVKPSPRNEVPCNLLDHKPAMTKTPYSLIRDSSCRSNKPEVIYTNDAAYIHGIAMSIDGSKVVLCATDKPNYSNVRPNETTILEIQPDGGFIRKIRVRQFRGKVYRIAENTNGEYVLTFPKEGCVLSVDSDGIIQSAFSKQTVTPNNTIDRARISSLKEFWPTGVCCNNKGSVFVTDWLGKRVIVLDSLCKFVRCIGSNYVNPNAICANLNLNTVWIGDKGRIHVWQT